MATRLTNEMRGKAIDAAVRKTFAAEDAALLALRTKLADDLYEHAYGSVQELVNKLPSRWLDSDDSLSISCEGFAYTWRRNEKTYGMTVAPENDLRMSRERRFPAVKTDDFTVDKDHSLWTDAQAVVQKHVRLYEAKIELGNKLGALLYSCNTFEQLEKTWPEGKDFYPARPANSKTALIPVTLPLELNKMLGIGQ